MNQLLRKLSLAAPTAAALLLATSALAATTNSIYPTEGGRTTLTLSKAFLADITAAKATLTTVAGAQLDANQVGGTIACLVGETALIAGATNGELRQPHLPLARQHITADVNLGLLIAQFQGR